MTPYESALEIILQLPFKVEVEEVPLLASRDRILATAITAPWPLPRFTNSAMDGFALAASTVHPGGTITRRIVGESSAGHPFEGAVPSDATIRISTGAPLPKDCDLVLPIEQARVDGNDVEFDATAAKRSFVRIRGEDVGENAPLFGAGRVVDAATLAFLASYNLAAIKVYRRPRVAILTSGDELRLHGETLGPSQIIAASIYYLESALMRCGCDPWLAGIARDDADEFRTMLESALESSDFVITTAGVSVGDHDVVGRAIKELGGKVHFHHVAVRPGKPMLLATFGEKVLFGFPGNPVSTHCNAEIFLKPFLRRAFGFAEPVVAAELARLVADFEPDRRRLFFPYARRRIEAGYSVVEAFANQSSGNLLNTAQANCLLKIPPGSETLRAGSEVETIPLKAGL